MVVSSHRQKFSCGVPDLQAMEKRLVKEAEDLNKLPNVSKILSILAVRACLTKVRVYNIRVYHVLILACLHLHAMFEWLLEKWEQPLMQWM